MPTSDKDEHHEIKSWLLNLFELLSKEQQQGGSTGNKVAQLARDMARLAKCLCRGRAVPKKRRLHGQTLELGPGVTGRISTS